MLSERDNMIGELKINSKVDNILSVIFGENNNKILFKELLVETLSLSTGVFKEIYLLDVVLLKNSKQDRKCILDIKIKTRQEKCIDLELEVSPATFMAEQTLLTWAKRYNDKKRQAKIYQRLQACIKVNTLYLENIPLNNIHYNMHILEAIDTGVIQWLKDMCNESAKVLEGLIEAVANLKRVEQISAKGGLPKGVKRSNKQAVKNFMMYKNKDQKVIGISGWSVSEIERFNTSICG